MSDFPQLDGIIVLNKPTGLTSARCLNLFKKLGQRKIGHAGTLDPLATGVLSVLLGQATKLADHLHRGGMKTYLGKMRLGIETDSWDMDGEIISEKSFAHVTGEDLLAELALWADLKEQMVPPISAAKFQGQPLYKLARKGKETPVRLKEINIGKVELLDYSQPYVTFRVTCSTGAYIRSLAHSLGKRLGCGAALAELTREYSHPYGLDKACSLDEIRENPQLLIQRLLPLDSALPEWPRLSLAGDQARVIRYGGRLPAHGLPQMDAEQAIAFENNAPLALLHRNGNAWSVLRGLWN